MKKLIAIFTFIPLFSFAQPGTNNSHAINGEIVVPILQSIKVELINTAPIHFETPEDINSAKIVRGLYKITVISTIPWSVHVVSSSQFLNNSSSNDQKMPVSAIQLRNSAGAFVPLSTTSITISKSTNEKIYNVFYVDARIKAEVEFGPGKFSAELLFTVSPD